MAKDPAFLFYPGDWLGGTMGMSLEEKGAYMELLMLQFNSGKFSIQQAKRTLSSSFNVVWPTLKDKFICSSDGYYNERLQTEKEKRSKFTESRRSSRLKSDEDSVKIYLIKDLDTGFFKIGSSVNPLRRFAEMTNQKDPAITIASRNYKLYFTSIVIERTVEKELHIKFSDKRISGEWFRLETEDLNYIISSYGNGTYVERTENENNIVYSILNNHIEENTNKEKTVMVIVEMMKTWMKYKPDYSFMKEVDYPALLKLAYFIAERKGWKKASVVGEREKDTLVSFEKICKFISTKEADAYLKRLTIDGISVPKNFQKLEESMKRGTCALEERQKESEKKRITPEQYFKD